ncbi:MAG: hypothetical protein CFE31_09575 [Rhizobiales bacterium PAR1]|nr:MAG: hypothetical protein CFE31_09575 [Rhizobiales bacterium PAR1]
MRLLLSALLAVGMASVASAQTVPDQPVMLVPLVDGGKAIAPAASVAQIVGLKKGGDGYVSVRGAPSPKGNERDRLTLGHYVLAANPLDDWKKATFIGVIYADRKEGPEGGLEAACGIENPPPPTVTAKKVYTGPCKSGWVHKRFVKVLAD